MAARRTSSRKRKKLPPPPPPPPQPREVGPVERALRGLGNRIIDIAAEDPDRLFQMGETALRGIEVVRRGLREDPEAVKRAAARAREG